MRNWKRLAASFLALCLLSGCSGLMRDSYVSVNEHHDPYAYKETEPETEEPTAEETEPPLQTADSYYGMMSILRGFVTAGVEHGQFLVTDMTDEAEDDLRSAFANLKTEDPLGAYAVDYMEYERTAEDGAWLVTVDAVYRRSVSEIEAIRSVRGNDRAMELITETMDQLSPSVTLRISGFTDEDFSASIRSYCLAHPNVFVQMPEVSVAIYPQSGNVRVVELHFSYNTDRETLRGMQTEAESVLASAERYAHYAQTDPEKLSLIYSYLTSRFSYVEDREEGSVYRLLCEGVGNSESFAAVTAWLCGRLGLDCRLVEGAWERPEAETGEQSAQPYDWVMVCIDAVWYHFDPQACALSGSRECALLLDGEMTGYLWDADAYPVCDGEAEQN